MRKIGVRCAILATFAVLLGGCASAVQSATPAASGFLTRADASGSWIEHIDAGQGLAYLDDFYVGGIDIYDRVGKIVGHIKDSTYMSSMFVDARRNLWVINEHEQTVWEIARGATKPKLILTDPNPFPGDVSVCPDGSVYVSNGGYTSQAANVEVYVPGSTYPTRSLNPAHRDKYFHGQYITCDAAGTVFWGIAGVSGVSKIMAFPGGEQAGSYSWLLPSKTADCGVKADPAGDLLVCDTSTQTITEYTEQGGTTGRSISASVLQDLAISRNGKVVGAIKAGDQGGYTYTFPGGIFQNEYVDPGFGTLENASGFAIDY